MKVSALSILACVASIVEGGEHRRVTAKTLSTRADANALAAIPEASVARQLNHRKKKKKRKKKENRDDDDDDNNNKSSSGGKRLMMYCEKKFRWQERSSCPSWCLEASSCKSGASLRIRKCGSSSKQKWKHDNGVLRPACSRSLSVGNGRLEKGSNKLSGLGKSRFEIRKGSKCFSNHHHPKDKELISFRKCDKARRSKTNLWTMKS